jgi:metallophosphoesterase superfamily enzyme
MKLHKSHIEQLAVQKNKEDTKKQLINSIMEMIKTKNIDIDEIGDISKVTLRQNISTDKNGELQTKTNFAVQLSPKWATGPEWPLVTTAPKPAKQRQKSKTKSQGKNGWETAVIIPDIQFGFYKTGAAHDAKLVAIHDDSAISVALQVISDVNPDLIVMVGDNLDFAEFGKYLTAPTFKQMIQPALDRAAEFLQDLRLVAPKAKIVWIQGNHEKRLPSYIQANAEAAFGLTRGINPKNNELRDRWPVLSLPVLLWMDELDIEYLSGYPEAAYYVNSNLRIVHGDKVVSNGSTTNKYLNTNSVSVIYGHIHRNELAYQTRETDQGPRTIMAASPGCLCRIDGAVPSVKSGLNEHGVPILQGAENWQQGLGIVQYQPKGVGGEYFNYEPMWIFNGRGMFRGKEYFASESK